MGLRGRKVSPPSERFHDKYEVDPKTGCWEWTAFRNNNGYGTIGITVEPGKSTSLYAHRVSYEMHHGPIPEGLVVDHKCNNPGCVNPDHLQVLTHRQNILRGAGPTIRLHWLGRCKRGHDLTDPANVYVRKDNGSKQCRECNRIRSLERSRRQGIPPRSKPQCGTYSGAIQHYRRGEKPCKPCLEAHAAYHAEYERRKRNTPTSAA